MQKLSKISIFGSSLQLSSIFFSRSPGVNVIKEGKLFFALIDQLKKDDDENKTIIALHSGGLSGIPGYENRYKIKLFS